MVLKKIYLLLFIFLFICFYGFSDVPLEKILENPFSVSPLIFDNDNIYFIEQNISLKDEDIFIDYVINNQSDNDIILPIKIICEIVADSKIVNDIVIPFDFQILKENMPISFDVYYENKKIEKKLYYEETSSVSYFGNSEIRFVSTIKKRSTETFSVKYKGLCNSGVNISGTSFMYKLCLAQNKSNQIISYAISFNNESSNLYLTDNNNNLNFYREGNKWNTKFNAYDENIIECYVEKFDFLSESYFSIMEYNLNFSLYYLSEKLDEKELSLKDLFYLSSNHLRLLRNAFYAIHGYPFKDKDLYVYFNNIFKNVSNSNYKINPKFSESVFNEVERKNIELIKEMENMKEPILLSDLQ